MRIECSNLGKRYRYEWIFRGLDYTFESGESYAITGPNGSGKSTLMRLLSGHLTPSKGKIKFEISGQCIDVDDVYTSLAYAAPYIDLIEEFTLTETINFHLSLREAQPGIKPNDLIDLLGFEKSVEKQIRHFSSGMKQRLKLALTLTSNASLILLDEPNTNLDQQGTAWYMQLVERFSNGKTIIVASNVSADYSFCRKTINIMNYK
jgi:ABC-type multidrug transport system ATPase subunit